jgi:RNA polymerase sigma factor (sigma-70 family)
MSTRRSRLLALNDPLLARYLSAADESGRNREMETLLIDQVQPCARGVLANYARDVFPVDPPDVEDLLGQVTMNVLRKLRAATVVEEESVQCLEAYVVTLTRNVIRDYMRRRTPNRTRLKRRLQYVFTHDARLALWSHEGMTLCGLAEWHGRADRANGIAGDVDAEENLAETLLAFFARMQKPVRLASLVDAMSEGEEQLVAVDDIPVAPPSDAVEAREYLRMLWREISALPPRQRAALLLNLREPGSGNAMLLFLTVRAATFAEIAQAVALTSEELAAIWEDLPFDDLRIAEHLGVSRQQVINLRKAARERLSRRMR